MGFSASITSNARSGFEFSVVSLTPLGGHPIGQAAGSTSTHQPGHLTRVHMGWSRPHDWLLRSHAQIVHTAIDLERGARRRAGERTRQVRDRASDLR